MTNAPPGAVDLVPGFDVSDTAKSREFYVDLLDFVVLCERPEQGFSYLGPGTLTEPPAVSL